MHTRAHLEGCVEKKIFCTQGGFRTANRPRSIVSPYTDRAIVALILRFISVKKLLFCVDCSVKVPGENFVHCRVEICSWKLTAEIFEYLPTCPHIDMITRSVTR